MGIFDHVNFLEFFSGMAGLKENGKKNSFLLEFYVYILVFLDHLFQIRLEM